MKRWASVFLCSALWAVALSAALCMNLVRTQTPTIDRAPVAYIEDLCDYLADRLLPNQKVVALVPTSAPMQYYLRGNEMALDSLVVRRTEDLWAGSERVGSVYVVVYTAREDLEASSFESIDSLVALSHAWDVSSARVVRRYDSALLYELQRKPR